MKSRFINAVRASPLGANVTVTGALTATPGGGEVALPSGSWDSEPLLSFAAGQVFSLTLTGLWYSSNDNGTFGAAARLRIREGTATTTGNVLGSALLIWRGPASAAEETVDLSSIAATFYVANFGSSDVATKLSMTLEVVRGSGGAGFDTFTVQGLAVAPLSILAEPAGSVAQNPDLAAIAAGL